METIFGAVVGLFVVYWLFSLVGKRNYSGDPPTRGWLVVNELTVLHMPTDKALEKCKEAIRLYNLKLERFEPNKGRLIALSDATFFAAGEIITVVVRGNPEGSIITVQSRPTIPFLLLDRGRNLTNVETMVKLIQN